MMAFNLAIPTQKPDSEIPLDEIVRRCARLVGGMMSFWKNAEGWAPVDAAHLLSKSMLGWQSSLADALAKWTGELTDGELVLAWANIGAIVEGQLKLFLSVYHGDYITSGKAIIKDKKGKIVSPDSASLEPLRLFFKKSIWAPSENWDASILLVQHRRNAIHAFKAKHIGTSQELHETLRWLLTFVRAMNDRLPYPDDLYKPHER